MKTYRVEVQSSEWGGMLTRGWTPAASGTLNQSGETDEAASTFARYSDARAFADDVLDQHPDRVRIVRSDGVVRFEEEHEAEE